MGKLVKDQPGCCILDELQRSSDTFTPVRSEVQYKGEVTRAGTRKLRRLPSKEQTPPVVVDHEYALMERGHGWTISLPGGKGSSVLSKVQWCSLIR